MKLVAAFLAGALVGTSGLIGLVLWAEENEREFRR